MIDFIKHFLTKEKNNRSSELYKSEKKTVKSRKKGKENQNGNRRMRWITMYYCYSYFVIVLPCPLS